MPKTIHKNPRIEVWPPRWRNNDDPPEVLLNKLFSEHSDFIGWEAKVVVDVVQVCAGCEHRTAYYEDDPGPKVCAYCGTRYIVPWCPACGSVNE